MMRTFSIAPVTAFIPCLMWAPSKAGPEAQEQDNMSSALPTNASVFVPMSKSKESSVDS